MSEQRFTITNKEWICYNGGYAYTVSNGECEFALWEDEEDAQKVCDYLNEQQATIQSLQTELELTENTKLFSRRELERTVKEQQATIRKLQDLCGESDGENAKLRMENKRLEKEVNLLRPTNIEQYEQIQKLQEENEQLQAQLREKEEDERLYANEIVKLNKEAKEVLDFKSLGGDY